MPLTSKLPGLTAQIETLQTVRAVGRVVAVKAGVVQVAGLASQARIGDWIKIQCADADAISGEVVQLQEAHLIALPDAAPDGVALNDRVILLDAGTIAPSDDWIGRVIDPSGHPLDGLPLLRGAVSRPLRAAPPQANERRPLGARLDTGMAITNTFLPIVKGQRVGLFAGSGVGKSSLLGHLAKHMEADVVVIAMIGERGRDVGPITASTTPMRVVSNDCCRTFPRSRKICSILG
jgi:flagellum-specific ATP synthase